MTKVKSTDINELSDEQLQELLNERKAVKQKEADEKRKDYEDTREKILQTFGMAAATFSHELASFKLDALQSLKSFRETMLEYGDLRRGEANKGSFEIKNDHFKIVFSTQINKGFDERSEMAEDKLKIFLETFVKKRDLKLHGLIMGLLERNTSGDLDINNINRLYKMENDFDDENWREAIRLFKESYNPTQSKEYVRFFVKGEQGEWSHLNLNFASIKPAPLSDVAP